MAIEEFSLHLFLPHSHGATVHGLQQNGKALPGQWRGLCIYAAVQSSSTEINDIFGLGCPVYLLHGSHLLFMLLPLWFHHRPKLAYGLTVEREPEKSMLPLSQLNYISVRKLPWFLLYLVIYMPGGQQADIKEVKSQERTLVDNIFP